MRRTSVGCARRHRAIAVCSGWLVCLVGCNLDFDRSARPDIAMTEGHATEPDAMEVQLELVGRYYTPGQNIRAALHVGHRQLDPKKPVYVSVLSTLSGDVESIAMWPSDTPQWRSSAPSVQTAAFDGAVLQNDGVLELAEGTEFTALFTPPHDVAGFEDLAGKEVFAAGPAMLTSASAAAPRIDATLARSSEDPASEALKPSGVCYFEGAPPVSFAVSELVFWARSEDQLKAFLTRVGGVELGRHTPDLAEAGQLGIFAVRVGVMTTIDDAAQLPGLLTMTGRETDVSCSSWEAQAIVSLDLALMLDGWNVSLNVRLDAHAPPTRDPLEQIDTAMSNLPQGCIPGDVTNPCILDAEAAWAYMELWDRQTPVNVAVLDSGFARNVDFRAPTSGAATECNFAITGAPMCGVGAAQGYGPDGFHGTGVVEVLGSVLGNGALTAGVAGQVAVPMLYQLGAMSYAFELGAVLKRAVDDGASVINLSAGFPCSGLVDIGPDPDLCGDSKLPSLCQRLHDKFAAAAKLACEATPEPRASTLDPRDRQTLCAAASGVAPIASAGCAAMQTQVRRDSPMRDGIRYAHRRGVPVVVSAGNLVQQAGLPTVGAVPLSADAWLRVEQQQTMPALIPETIVVAAVDANTLDNSQLFGARVDLWAPSSRTWFAPMIAGDLASPVVAQAVPFGGTSAAAPFVTGAIALMQSIHPALDPQALQYRAGAMTPMGDGRGQIVETLRGLLQADENSWSNSELSARGYRDQPERRRLIDPLALLRAAGKGVLPDVTPRGYDATLNYSEAVKPDDTLEQAQPLRFGVAESGTILSMPSSGSAKSMPDRDWYQFTMPKASDLGLSQSKAPAVFVLLQALITVARPVGYGELSVSGAGVLALPVDRTLEEQTAAIVVAAPGGTISFAIASPGTEDNVYSVRVEKPTTAVPVLTIVAPTSEEVLTLCANRQTTMRATATYPAAPRLRINPDAIEWTEQNQRLGLGLAPTLTFAPGEHDLQLAYQSPLAVDRLHISAKSCPGKGPGMIAIAQPAAYVKRSDMGQVLTSGSDGRGDYVELTLAGSASDPEDGALVGQSLRWTTDQVDIQPALLGTGSPLRARLYYKCAGKTHIVRLTATDADQNTDTAEVTIETPDYPCGPS